MNRLLKKIEGNAIFIASIKNCETELTPILQGFITNFPEYTDHSINHSKTVLGYAGHLINTDIEKLNEDEIYILIMADFLHDIGMCPTNEMKKHIKESNSFRDSGKDFENYLRDIHHELSYQYITTFWKELKIVNETYAEAIGLVAMGHRQVELLDFEKYNPEFVVKSGNDFVCLPYLTGILRLADELDITNDRTHELLYNEYFPTNRISKEEWEKHKANYFVTFNKPTIKITSKCFEKNLYYSLLKQYKKIDEVIKYVQKIVNTIPLNDRRLKLDYLKLEKDIKTIGFIPKDIGFSFDLQNTINTFIGDNIYKNKFVAIRECLQNAIDTCRYKKQISQSAYQPKIAINLTEKELTISDNGLGMDEYIIENYFSKLAKSYYKESKVSKEFESISQFGIGVFSYFLLCDVFEVESKQEGKPSVKFRATKDTDCYFYFYDNSAKLTSGTTITYFLSNDISFEELLDQVKHYIRFVEFPIDIIYKKRHEIVSTNDFTVDKYEILGKHIDREYLTALQDLQTIDAKISDSECDGILSLLISEDQDGTYIPIYNYDTLHTFSTSVIQLSQKGIYIGKDKDRRLNNIIGIINLKQKNDIDLGRYHIKSSSKIQSVSEKFYKIILQKLFENWQLKTPEIKRNLSRNLIGYYFEDNAHFKKDFIEQYFDNLYYKVYTGENIEFLNVNKIIDFDEFIIVRGNTPFRGYRNKTTLNIEEIYSLFKKPLVVEEWAPPASFLLNIFKERKNYIFIKCTDKHWYFSIKPQVTDHENQSMSLAPKYDGYIFEQPHICACTNLWVENPFNINHEIIKFFISNKEQINKEQRLFKYFDDFFQATSRFISNFHSSSSEMKDPTSEIVYLNSLLKKINETLGTQFIFTKKDFPKWINQKIKW
jgi:molecular chaperone HtpG